LIGDDQENSVFAWARFSDGTNPVVMISNLTPVLREGYSVPMPKAGRWIERINTDAEIYGGTGKGNSGVVIADQAGTKGQPASAMITLPPMATLILEYQKQ
jgi:1,4-alpha-glucan branching enzyme